VGTFVKSLFGDRRDERQAALQHALDLADRQVLEEQRNLRPPQQTGTHSTLSSVTGPGGSGITSSRGVLPSSPNEAGAVLAVPNTLDVVEADAPLPAPGRRRLLLYVAAAGVLALVGGFVIVAMSGGAREHGSAAAGAASSAVAVSSAKPTPASAPSGEAVDPSASSAEPAATETAPAPSDTAPVARLPATAPTVGTARPLPITPKPKNDGWNKHDPGF